jgi:RNA polymerase sigma-70 factor, ECF subfamily
MSIECTPTEGEAVRVITAHYTMLKTYLRAIIFNPGLVEDALSEVKLTLLQTWEQYDPDRPFGPWARGVARRVAYNQSREEFRQGVTLDEAALEELACQMDREGDESHLDGLKEALRACLTQLPAGQERLIRMKYFDDQSYEEISGVIGKTVRTLYVVFNRVHQTLQLCVRKEVTRL